MMMNEQSGYERASHMQELLALGRQLSATGLDVEAILSLLADRVSAVCPTTPLLVFAHDARSGTYRVHQTRQWHDDPGEASPFADSGPLARWLTQNPRALVWGGQAGAPVPPGLSAAETQYLESQGARLLVPLVAQEELAGWIVLGEPASTEPHTPALGDLLTAFAHLGAMALVSNRSKSEFIDFVAHELKQPMTAMQGYAKMLAMGIGGEINETQAQFVQVITANVDRMGRLVNNLLAIARLEAGRIQITPSPVDLGAAIEEVVTNARSEISDRCHSLSVDVAADLPLVLVDRERLLEILSNLVSNAVKYTPKGGRIQICAQPSERPDLVVVSIRDTGIGLSSDEIDRLGEKFFRGDHDLVQQQPGTGLGLSITRNLVQLHRGTFQVDSEPGQGSTFSFTVPIAKAA